MTQKRLDGQIAWVSGAASGMGEAIAELFAAEGACVALVDIQVDQGQEIERRIIQRGEQALFVECDVAQEKSVRHSITRTVEQFGGLNILVNCAGIVQVTPLHESSEAEWDHLMGVNVKSIFLSLKHGIEYMRRGARSYVVNIGSVSSFVGQANTPAYITSKHAVLGLSRAIALDYAADGLRCNCICPGITDTPLLRYHLSKEPDPGAALANRLRRVPMGIALMPHDIAMILRRPRFTSLAKIRLALRGHLSSSMGGTLRLQSGKQRGRRGLKVNKP
ncbi:SDR family oxidoreductase [Chloroflexi bacterium TSY]|nr:SDR family oxidoreductase [Chloroflexi bacterium TSY]